MLKANHLIPQFQNSLDIMQNVYITTECNDLHNLIKP